MPLFQRFRFRKRRSDDEKQHNEDSGMSIGAPYQVKKLMHIEFDNTTGEFKGMPQEWQDWMVMANFR